MNADCLMKIQPLISDQIFNTLEKALKTGDNYLWDSTMIGAHADIVMLKRQAILDADVLTKAVQHIKNRVEAKTAYDAIPGKAKAFKGLDKGATASQALSDMISGSGSRQSSGIVSLDRSIVGVRGPEMARLTQLLHETRPTMLGLKRLGDGEFNSNLVRSIFGSKGAKVTKEMQVLADAWKATTRSLRERFNKAGGDIEDFEGFNIPVNHDVGRISKFSKEEWIEDAKRLFDRRIGPEHTIKVKGEERAASLTDEAFFEVMHKSISTDGAVELDANLVGGMNKPKLGDAHQKFRYLQPKNGDAWLEYTSKYGKHSRAVDSMVEYVDTMSTNIALMETFGSNPVATFKNLVDHVRRVTGNTADGNAALASMDQIVARNPGFQSDSPIQALAGIRNIQTATKLGMAPITAITDVAYSVVTAMYAGMSPIKVFARHMKLLAPGSSVDRKLASRLGLVMDSALSRAAAINRFADSVGYSALHTVADVSVRASGLNHWTNSGKTAFGLEFLANMGDVAKSGKLPTGGLKHAFERYGITDADWGILKTVVDDNGFIDVTKLGPRHDDLTTKVLGMVSEETSFAIPEPNARARSVTQLKSDRNTVANEWIKTLTQFKSFGVSTMLTHGGRILNDTTSAPARVLYASSLIAASGAMGVAALQLKDIAKGKTPRELDMKLAAQGIMQGGVLGALGDVVFNDPKLFGGLASWMVGPTISDFDRLKSFFIDAGTEAEAKGIAAAWYNEIVPGVIQGAERNSFVTRLWYTRLAFERGLMNTVNTHTDSKFQKKQIATRKRMQRETGQQMWYE